MLPEEVTLEQRPEGKEGASTWMWGRIDHCFVSDRPTHTYTHMHTHAHRDVSSMQARTISDTKHGLTEELSACL